MNHIINNIWIGSAEDLDKDPFALMLNNIQVAYLIKPVSALTSDIWSTLGITQLTHNIPHRDFEKEFSSLMNQLIPILDQDIPTVVVCRSGMHRSVALVWTYIMLRYGLSCQDAFCMIKQARIVASLYYRDLVLSYIAST